MIIEDARKLKDFIGQIDHIPKLKAIVVWDCEAPAGGKVSRSDGTVVKVMTWADFLKLGKETDNKLLETRITQIKSSHCCGLIYTSGTTGDPKAVMISHDNIVFLSRSVIQSMALHENNNDRDIRIISYLPLSHVAGLMVDIISPLCFPAFYKCWTDVAFARPYDLKMATLPLRIAFQQPVLFLGVPRVWEKIAEKMKAVGATITGVKKTVSTWAKAKSLKHQLACNMGGTGYHPRNLGLALKILGAAKQKLGLDRMEFAMTGAAPISKETLEYFGQLGIQINEVYGMSECTGATTFSSDFAHVWGSCGWAVPGCEIKCFKVNPENNNDKTECPKTKSLDNPPEADQGEICYRGRHIMMGYMANPDLGPEHVREIEKKTNESIDKEGWLHSGDKGCIDTRGMVKITGRYKELIIGSGGENIAPVPIEDGIKQACQGLSNVMMVGDQRKFNVAIVTLKAKGATGDLPGGDELDGGALLISPATKTITEAMADPVWHKAITDAIAKVNKSLPPPSRIQRFTILPLDFSVDTEELTPTFKTKRSVVEKKYADTIESMFDDNADKTKTYFSFIPIRDKLK
jgi:long-chain-fatty-acid--CoA ligase ACSBG